PPHVSLFPYTTLFRSALQRRLDDLLREGHIIGASPAFRRMMTLVDQVANSSATVLIQGESGTGKELIARRIHDRSPRRQGPFVEIGRASCRGRAGGGM